MDVGKAIALVLVDEGIDAVFSLLGDGTARIVHHLAEAGLPVYEGRHEAYVYAMADGYSRATGSPTVCAITGGPAVGHTFTPMTSAARTESSVILLTGPSSRDDLRGRQQLDHRAMTELTGAAFFPIHGPEVAVQRVRETTDFVRASQRPAVLDVPEVVQTSAVGAPIAARPRPAWTTPRRLHPDPQAIGQAVGLIAAAERPVVLAGGGTVASGARDELIRLGEATGALLATTINARGLFHGDRFDAGVSGGFASDPAIELFRQADVVISFGAGMDRFVTRGGALFPNAAYVQVDVKQPGPMASGAPADCYVQGDALVVATALRTALASRPPPEGYRTGEVAARLADPVDPATFEIEDGQVDPRELCARLDELLPENCGWVSGNSGHFWAFPITHMRRWRQPLLHASYFGAIGYGIPVGLGATLAIGGNPVVVFEGDAGAMMHIQVMETAARYGARMLVVVLNDGALGAEYHNLVAEGYQPELSLTPDPDLAGLVRHLGCRGATLTDLDRLPNLVSEFLSGGGPMLIDARVSRRVISRPTRRAVYHLPE
ncbi:MAG: thiamine pyrophosphate-binding protein [Acidimicrobiia bacterium]|nr:thiamine pyrophosphate-binding protein [Acidimicrobiia bacterium]